MNVLTDGILESVAEAVAERVIHYLESRNAGTKQQERLLTETEFSTRSGIPRKTLQSWRSRNCGPTFRRFGRSVRYPESELCGDRSRGSR